MAWKKIAMAFRTALTQFHLIALAGIGLVVGCIYIGSLNAPFVFDDMPNIVENPYLRISDLSLDSLKRPLTQGQGVTRPVGTLTFALNYYWGKYEVTGYRIVNMLIHWFNGALVYALAFAILRRRMVTTVDSQASQRLSFRLSDVIGRPTWLALWTALIFVAHPLQTQAVTYVVQRYTSLAAMFYLAAVLCFVWGRSRMVTDAMVSPGDGYSSQESDDPPKRERAHKQGGAAPKGFRKKTGRRQQGTLSAFRGYLWFFPMVVCGVLAILTKQNAASLPGAILLMEFLLFDRSWRGWKRKMVWLIPTLMLLGAGMVLLAGTLNPGMRFGNLLEDVSRLMRETESVSRWAYLCTQFNVLLRYIGFLVLPVGQSVDHLYPMKTGFLDGFTPLGFLFLSGLAAVAVWQANRRPLLTFAIAWFFITLSVESSILPISDPMVEHRLYLPMFGFALWIVSGIASISSRQHTHATIWAAGGLTLIVVALGLTSGLRNGVWQNEINLWEDALAKNADNHRAHANLGTILWREGRKSDGLSHYQQALSLKPNYPLALFNMGLALEQQGDLVQAERYYRKTLAQKPDYVKSYVNLGVLVGGQQRYDEAARYFRKALEMQPRSAEIRANLAMALMGTGAVTQAVKHYRQAVSDHPTSGVLHFHLAQALLRVGDTQGAIKHLHTTLRLTPKHAGARGLLSSLLAREVTSGGGLKALYESVRLAPDSAEAHYNLGVALAREGQMGSAIKHYREAVRLDPNHLEAHTNLGVALAQRKLLDEAVVYLEKALQINPNSAEVQTSMGAAQYMMGNFQAAMRYYTQALQIDPDFKQAQRNLQLLLRQGKGERIPRAARQGAEK